MPNKNTLWSLSAALLAGALTTSAAYACVKCCEDDDPYVMLEGPRAQQVDVLAQQLAAPGQHAKVASVLAGFLHTHELNGYDSEQSMQHLLQLTQ